MSIRIHGPCRACRMTAVLGADGRCHTCAASGRPLPRPPGPIASFLLTVLGFVALALGVIGAAECGRALRGAVACVAPPR